MLRQSVKNSIKIAVTSALNSSSIRNEIFEQAKLAGCNAEPNDGDILQVIDEEIESVQKMFSQKN